MLFMNDKTWQFRKLKSYCGAVAVLIFLGQARRAK